MIAPNAHPSSVALEEWAFAPAGQRRDESVGEHVGSCEQCAQTVSGWQAERAAFLAQRPAQAFLDRVSAAAPSRRPMRARAFAAVAIAASLLVLLWRVHPSSDVAHLKGSTNLTLELLVSRDGAVASPTSIGEVFGPGDVVRFVVSVPREGFVFIANLDAAGHFTRYYPPAAPKSAPVHQGARQVLPGSIELDEYQGEERVVLFFSDVPLEEARVEQALRAAFGRAGLDALEHAELPAMMTAVPVHKGPR